MGETKDVEVIYIIGQLKGNLVMSEVNSEEEMLHSSLV